MEQQAGKLQSFEETMIPHLNAAYNLARWLTRHEQDAEDVVQEAYLRAYRFFDGFKGGDGKAWLLAVVRNTYFSRVRREKHSAHTVTFDEALHDSGDTPGAESTLMNQENLGSLKECMDALHTNYREVLVMRELEELSYQQIAEVAAIPPGTVMSRLSRARKLLQNCVRARVQGGRK